MMICRYYGYGLEYDFFCSVVPSSSAVMVTARSLHRVRVSVWHIFHRQQNTSAAKACGVYVAKINEGLGITIRLPFPLITFPNWSL